MDDTVITREGFERLSEELERLRRATGDEALLERRIALLEERLRSARIVDPQPGNGRIDVGEGVRLRDLDSGEPFELELVGPLEADPSRGRISVASPLGKAIHGLRRGEVADVDAPRGRLRYEVVAVEASALSRGG
jgi:transcription elongation factor GreA